ncbi:hypothetical protein CPAR01_00988 [Colletotrichum paranaense]|uniref:Uncharacterized protein n=1 Tax=Colletotrichum paranaense TaxID=1914294 RepID=A0ABQ9T5F8_9PEZI|nr:uncharacterized protein CPAR01_00988 [Colletotrichum paranaense]KAK1547021.1 hypothetical protein CPAR01_00988 [Colletotrichum paranaense]
MAQARMPELADMVRRQYHRFPSDTWEATRLALDNPEPHRLFEHIETLISTRKIDAILHSNADFRGLMASLYGQRYEWLQDADLGDARWGVIQEEGIEDLAAQAKAAEDDGRSLENRKRDIMLRKLVEGGDDLGRWAKVLGFEGTSFSRAEIEAVAAKMRTESGLVEGEGRPAYGVGEEREGIGGPDTTGCLDGPEGTYGPSTYAGQSSLLVDEEPVQPESVPRAPAEGGEAPRNPFTTEWRARDNPGNWKWPQTLDPYYSSNHFIRRSTKCKHPERNSPPDDDDDGEEDEEEDNEDDSAQEWERDDSEGERMPTITSTQGEGSRSSQKDKGRKGSWLRRGQPPKTSRPTTTERLPRGSEDGRASVRFSGVTESPPKPQGLVKSPFVLDTRATPPRDDTTAPYITVADTSSSTGHRLPASRSGRGSRLVRNSALAPPSTQPPRIFTPVREIYVSESASPSTASEASDVDMVDPEPEDADAAATTTTRNDGETSEDLRSRPYDSQWLINWFRQDPATTEEDLRMIDYKGWRVHAPKLQLVRIKNFLADEDIDRTLDWERKCAEIGEFLQYCIRMDGVTKKDWYVDLREAISMLRTHALFEEHHYGTKKLVVDFPKMGAVSTRLPPLLDGRDIVVEKRARDPVRPRYLLHRVPESVQDVDYQIPGPLLRMAFLKWFREDGNLVWATDPNSDEAPGSGERGQRFGYEPDFNMALTEDEWFAKCMTGGPEATSDELHSEANFYLLMDEYVGGEVNTYEHEGKTRKLQKFYPEGETQQRFARFRGAKRAALQQCLSHFNSEENVALASPFRKLVLPLTKREKAAALADAKRDIVYKPHSVKAPPPGTKLDPLGITYWHNQMQAAHRVRAYTLWKKTVRSHEKLLEDMGVDKDTVRLPEQLYGPVTPWHFLRKSERRVLIDFHHLRILREKLTSAYNKDPREMLEGVIKNIEYGLKGAPSWDVEEVLAAHREKNGGHCRPLKQWEVDWLKFVCGPSTTVKAQQSVLPKLGRDFDVFVARMQALLNEPSQVCLFAGQDRKNTLPRVAGALNDGIRTGDYFFTDDLVNKYSKVLAEYGRLTYERSETGEVSISRPKNDWHPEHRMNWDIGTDWAQETDHNKLLYHRLNVPNPFVTWEWPSAFAKLDEINLTRTLTKELLWTLGYRLGVELARCVVNLPIISQRLNHGNDWEYRKTQLQDVLGMWGSSFSRNRPGEEDTVTPRVSYKSVVKAGEPQTWTEEMTEEEAREVVRRGIIDELSRGHGTLWPSRPRWFHRRRDDKRFMTLHHERIWDWASPGVCGKKKRQFFSMNRWPVHLQSRERQEEIRRSVTDEGLRKQAEADELRTKMARLAESVRPTADEIRQTQIAQMLSVPYHVGDDRRTDFFPGVTEYWGGDTESQRRDLERRAEAMINEELFPNDGIAPRGAGWISREAVQTPGAEIPELIEIDPDLVPRSVPAWVPSGRRTSSVAGGASAEETQPTPATGRQSLFPPRHPPRQRQVRFNVAAQEGSDSEK